MNPGVGGVSCGWVGRPGRVWVRRGGGRGCRGPAPLGSASLITAHGEVGEEGLGPRAHMGSTELHKDPWRSPSVARETRRVREAGRPLTHHCLLNMHFCTTFHPGHQSTWHTVSPERFKRKMSDHRFLSHLITGWGVPVTWPASTQAAPLLLLLKAFGPGGACGQIQRQARIAAKC